MRQTTTRTNQNRHFTSCKQQTLRCLSHNYARFDVPRREGDGDEARDGVSLSAGILMGHLRRRSRKESETGLLALNIYIARAAVNKSLLNRRSDEMFYVADAVIGIKVRLVWAETPCAYARQTDK